MANWTEGKYSSYHLDLGIVSVTVFWESVARGEPTGYRYQYGNIKSKALYKSSDDAKADAEKSVRNRLQKALKMLGGD